MTTLQVAGLIHNARNRLVAIADRVAARGQADEVAEIHRAARLLANAMVLLRFGQTETAIQRDEVDLNSFFADLADEVAQIAPGHLVTNCQADFSACLLPFWTFDSQFIRLVLIDALMNAWRHAEARVDLEMNWRDGELAFTISDDGPGFPPAFLTASANQRPAPREFHGTGNGLRLASEIAQKHANGERCGRLVLSNATGAVFRLFLP